MWPSQNEPIASSGCALSHRRRAHDPARALQFSPRCSPVRATGRRYPRRRRLAVFVLMPEGRLPTLREGGGSSVSAPHSVGNIAMTSRENTLAAGFINLRRCGGVGTLHPCASGTAGQQAECGGLGTPSTSQPPMLVFDSMSGLRASSVHTTLYAWRRGYRQWRRDCRWLTFRVVRRLGPASVVGWRELHSSFC